MQNLLTHLLISKFILNLTALATWHGVVHDIVLYGILMLLFLGIRMFIYQINITECSSIWHMFTRCMMFMAVASSELEACCTVSR